MRYAYVKNGDAVAQVRRIVESGKRAGADANIGGFLAAHRSDDVLVLCRSHPADRFEVSGVVAQSLPGPEGAGALIGRVVAAVRVGARILAWQPDRVVCGCGREMLWVSVAAAKVRGVPVVVARHTGMPARRGVSRLSYAIESYFLRRSHAVVAHGPFLVDSLRQAGVESEKVHEFDVDLGDFASDTRSGPIPQCLAQFVNRFSLLVMYVGRMQTDKGILDLLEAVARLRGSVAREVGLVYVGDGDDFERLRMAVAAGGMGDRVLLMGRIPHDVLSPVMRCATVIATPTRPPLQEGRCMVVAESFVVGVPVVAPAYAAFPYFVDHGRNGLLFKPGSVDDLSRGIEQLAGDRSLVERLRDGALASGRKLLGSRGHDFASAVQAAFR